MKSHKRKSPSAAAPAAATDAKGGSNPENATSPAKKANTTSSPGDLKSPSSSPEPATTAAAAMNVESGDSGGGGGGGNADDKETTGPAFIKRHAQEAQLTQNVRKQICKEFCSLLDDAATFDSLLKEIINVEKEKQNASRKPPKQSGSRTSRPYRRNRTLLIEDICNSSILISRIFAHKNKKNLLNSLITIARAFNNLRKLRTDKDKNDPFSIILKNNLWNTQINQSVVLEFCNEYKEDVEKRIMPFVIPFIEPTKQSNQIRSLCFDKILAASTVLDEKSRKEVIHSAICFSFYEPHDEKKTMLVFKHRSLLFLLKKKPGLLNMLCTLLDRVK